MIYLKAKNGQVKEYKDHDTKTVNFLLETDRWVRVTALKDTSLYSAPKKTKKKSK